MYAARFRKEDPMTPKLVFLLVLSLLMLCPACARAADNVIDPGDRVRVIVLGVDDMSGEGTVNAQGNIAIPIVGVYRIGGKSTEEAAAELAGIVRKWVKQPHVEVLVVQKAPTVVLVSGKVRKPGAYALGARSTLLELVGLAGGADENADLAKVSLIHSGASTAGAVNLQDFIDGKSGATNPALANGDTIMVPEKVMTLGVVFVLGEVRRIGTCELRAGMRIHDAIAQAGGITDMADPQAASLKSKDGEPAKFDLTKALAQDAAEDKVLSAGDTIYIQTTSGTFNIYGAVNRPGSYPIKQSIPLTDALALAGGYTARAKIQSLQIMRTSQNRTIPINLADVQKRAQNVAVLPGDTIVVPERGEKTSIWQVISAVGVLGWLIPR
jgi:polysaccharide biosynthesis/export protein